MTSCDQWGPFACGLEPAERLARLRCLRTLAHMLCGPAGLALQASIRRAETEPTDAALYAVLTELDALPSIPRRHVLASYAAVSRNDRAKVATD